MEIFAYVAECHTLAESSSSWLWILVQGAIPMATTRTFEEVLASEWSLTAWPRCFVMPNRRPLVRIHAPGEGHKGQL